MYSELLSTILDNYRDIMKQAIIIGGGEVFASKEEYYDFLRRFSPLEQPGYGSWKDWIAQAISHEYNVRKPQMPASWRADYIAWKIWFEKMRPQGVFDNTILIGYSLGAMFLMRYLSENTFDSPISQLHLVSGEWHEDGYEGFYVKKQNFENISQQCENIYVYHSKDDSIVSFEHAKNIIALLPGAHFFSFETRGHFFQPAFPELLQNIGCYKK